MRMRLSGSMNKDHLLRPAIVRLHLGEARPAKIGALSQIKRTVDPRWVRAVAMAPSIDLQTSNATASLLLSCLSYLTLFTPFPPITARTPSRHPAHSFACSICHCFPSLYKEFLEQADLITSHPSTHPQCYIYTIEPRYRVDYNYHDLSS